MAEVLLIHGSCFGAWAWAAVVPALNALGHSARALDLPGRGGGDTSLEEQAQAVVAALHGPAVLVGHSAGGYAISAAAEGSPLVVGLVFVAAYVPKPGMSLADMRRAGPSQPLRGSFRVTADRSAYGFAPDRCKDLFFHDCVDASDRLCLEPIAPQETAMAALRPLPRAAVICTDDRAIPPTYQRDMAAGMVQESLPSGHCPFLSMPGALAFCLDRLIGQMEIATDSVAD